MSELQKAYNITNNSDSDKNLILRQQYGLTLLYQLEKGVNIINADESVICSEANGLK